MKRRAWIVIAIGLLTVAGAWRFWSHDRDGQRASVTGNGKNVGASLAAKQAAASAGGGTAASSSKVSTLNTNKLAYRLANTTNSIRQLETMPHAILLANAFIDTEKALDLKIPAHLRSSGDPGAYIVQARGAIDARFRNVVAAAGGQVVSYIPNHAYLVSVAASGAGQLAGNPLVQAVLPYEPYYKLQSSLLGLAVNQQPLPPGTALTLGLFAADAATGEAQLAALGARILGHDQSPFGPVVRVLAPTDWTTLVQSPVVQFAEPARTRVTANDLSRVTLGISVDTLAPTNYLNLYGSNVVVAVNDSGVDINHPDFTTGGSPATGPGGAPIRVKWLTPLDMVDTNGHGTHVAGIIAGNGDASWGMGLPSPQVNVGAMAEGSVTNADFRGKAPLATLFSLNMAGYTDYQLQTNAALAGALISNNSWDYGNGDAEYDLAAASYDFATRDALPGTPGSQPVLFVFAAGNQGGGNNDDTGGSGDTILSPGTAKNVITVGALEQLRNITNLVSTITAAAGTNAPTTNQVAYWQQQTDSGDQVAYYSSRGNVGIGIEGDNGRFKPDVVSPGTMVISTSSQFNGEWDTNAYYNSSNVLATAYTDQIVPGYNGLSYYNVPVPPNAVAITISVFPNHLSPNPFPILPIYCQKSGQPDPVTSPGLIDITSYTDEVSIPPGGGYCTFTNLAGTGLDIAVGNTNNFTVNYNLTIQILVTNDNGDLYAVLEGMNDSLGGYYRYESGTSMAAASVSGVLALIQDYFANQFQPPVVPSPALLKAVLLNGARTVPGHGLAFTNGINFQGWGVENITNSVPLGGMFNQFGTLEGSSFFVDQSPANALATGDSHTYTLTVDPAAAEAFVNLQATLVWTDPPGDPAAAIKLVNSLELVITDTDPTDGNFGSVYIGNDFSSDNINLPSDTNQPPNIDTVNNVQSIILPPLLAGTYSVTVVGRSVNVNAVTAQTNNALGQYAPNIVQDYALVISVGEGEVTNAFSVLDNGIMSNPTADQNLTAVLTTNAPLMNQLVGASSPLLGTNSMPLGANTIWGPNGVLTLGQTNQWHFYVVTNTGLAPDYTNAAFITFQVDTLSIPRMGVYESAQANATKPEANLDMFVTEDPSITNLNPVAISNCLAGVGNSRASLYNAGTQFVYYTNSVPGSSVYYIGVQSEDQMASEYAFLPVFTDVPFGSLDQNGNEIVNGLLLPMPTPTGNNSRPGITNIFALAILPMQVEKITVTNLVQHQNFGDLFGSLSFGGQYAVLNDHDGFGNTFGYRPIVYDDMPNNPVGTTNTDGPGSLLNFRGKSALGPWILTELDDAAGGYTGQVTRLTLMIQPHRNLKQPGIIVSVPPGGWFNDWVDVPAGYTNLTFYATNVMIPPATPPIQMYERFGTDPTLTDFDQEATLTNGNPEGATISIGPPLAQGQYYIGLYNPNTTVAQNVFLSITLGINSAVNDIYNFTSGGGQTLLDDAVTPTPGGDPSGIASNPQSPGSTITVPSGVTNLVSSVNVGLVINSPRISDYAFTLVSPMGQRVLLMENRGGGDTNGAGLSFPYTNVLNSTATGGAAPNTNYLAVSSQGEVVPITWNFFTVPDQMTVYSTTNPALFNPTGPYCLYNTGLTNNPTSGPGSQTTVPVTHDLTVLAGVTNLTIIMNQFGNPEAGQGDAWVYTAGAAITNYEYLEFTDSTNLASVPIKFAAPPFNFANQSTNFTLSDLDAAVATNYFAPTNIADGFGAGWSVPTNLVQVTTVEANGQFVLVTNVVVLSNNLVSVITDPSTAATGDAGGSNYLALGNGTITRAIPTVPGQIYNVTFWYRGPGIAGWWRGEGNALDSSDPENDHNNGTLIGRFNFPAGEVDQAFEFEDPGNPYQFAGTNTYVQVPASPSLNVGVGGGFTVEGWINPTNLSQPEPLVEWLAQVPTNPATADTNLALVQGPVLDPATGHYYYLLAATNWTTSEQWAKELGGDLVTLNTANEQQWVYDTFTAYGTTNRDLWTGLHVLAGKYTWVSDGTSPAYTDWAPGEPGLACPTDQFVAITGPTNAYPGLWNLLGDNGQMCAKNATNPVYGVVEVNALPTNGVQFWVSGTNWTPGQTNTMQGSLCANIVDTNFVSHWIFSAPGLLMTNVYQHVALTFNTNSGVAALYLNGTNVAMSNLYTAGTSFTPKTDGDVLLGWDMSLYTNNFFVGEMDEMSIYSRALSLAEISAIYGLSADTTNRLVGKFDPAITPAVGLAEAVVQFGASSNVIFGVNNQWSVNSYTFTATSNAMPLTISGIAPGILLDGFAVQAAPQTNLYYFPEQPLAGLNGTPADGNWTLQVWDSRVGAFVTNANQLVNWQLSFVLDTNALVSASLPPETPITTTVPSGQIVYYSVTVPAWAQVATNILVSASQPVNLFFNETNLPTGSGPGDYTLLTAATSGVGSPLLTINGTPPLLPGQTYYLGVQNNNPQSATVVLEVDYDILTLTNGAPYTDVLTNAYSAVRYFAYDVGPNAYEATFQLLQLSGNADLVVSQGAPLPVLNSENYGSFNPGTADENIYVLTNSAPVPLSAGRWYLGVLNRDGGPITYSVLAKELDVTNGIITNGIMPAIINLTNGAPYAWTAGPGAALTNFFHFQATNPVVKGSIVPLFGLRFELFNLSGNGDLTVQTNALPLAPPFYQSSQNGGTLPELIFVFTNNVLTNLAADWYLGVPNREVTNISYSLVVEELTNLYFPAFPGAEGAGGGAAGGRLGDVYHVTTTQDAVPGSLRAAVTTAVTNRTVVFDVAGTIELLTPLVITNSDLTIAGETAPGGGITVAGELTTVQSAHDVVIRDVRFRSIPGSYQKVVWYNGFEGGEGTPVAGAYFSGGWYVDFGSVDVIYDYGYPGALAYAGTAFIDLDGGNAGGISTNLVTTPGVVYSLDLAYSRNPDSPGDGVLPRASVLIDGQQITSLVPNYINSWSNLNWQAVMYVFTATSNNTHLAVHSLDAPADNTGVLLDAFQLATNAILYYNFEGAAAGPVLAGQVVNGWAVSAPVSVVTLPPQAFIGHKNYLALGNGSVSYSLPTFIGQTYAFTLVYGNSTPAGSAEALFTLQGITTNITLVAAHDNANWQQLSFYFTAKSANTPVVIRGLAPGMWLDGVAIESSGGLGGSLQFNAVSNVIADHVSASWSTNAELAILSSTNVTVQWSILADSLYGVTYPSVGSVMQQGSGPLSLHHNLYADNYSGSPQLGGSLTLDFVNNVVYNWGLFSGLSDGTNDFRAGGGGLTNELNYVGNYLIAGADTAKYSANNYNMTNIAFFGTLTNAMAALWIFQTNNFMDSDNNGVLNGSDTGWGMFTNDYLQCGWGFPTPPVSVSEAYQSYEQVLDFAGVNLALRDPADTNIVTGVRNQSGRIIGSAPSLPGLGTLWPYSDTDQDGIPDFWESTFTPGLLYVPSNNHDRDGDGYTDLEEYNNWLAAPHALTVTNASVGVDLYQLCGNSGHLAFFVTNSIHGVVYLTNVLGSVTNTSPSWSNSIAIFTPTNSASGGTNYYGYASFDCYVTNLDTAAYFGPVTVSVIVSAVPLTLNSNMPPVITILYSGEPDDPCFSAGVTSQFYGILITTNDYGALFELDGPTGPVALVVSDTNGPLPSLSNYKYYTNQPPSPANLEIAVLANSTPTPLHPGTWYMAAVNEAGSNVCYTAKISKLQHIYAPTFSYPSNGMVFTGLETVRLTIPCVAVDTNAPPLPLSFTLTGPTNMYLYDGVIYWVPTAAQAPSTNEVVVSVSNGAFSVTNAFSIIVLESNLPPVLPRIGTQIVQVPEGTLLVSNTAVNRNVPAYPLTYALTTTVTGANQPAIDANGTITWSPSVSQADASYLFTTVVTDYDPLAVNDTSVSAMNSFQVVVVQTPSLPPGQPTTNTVAAGSIAWYPVVVPDNATAATNTLLFSSLPVNLWYSAHQPPGITNAGDTLLLPLVTNGVSVLSTNLATAPINLVPGGLYFLGVQNNNGVPVTNALQIDFALAEPPGLTLPVIPNQEVAAGDLLVVANTATATNASAVLNYQLVNAPLGAGIDGNGLITWATPANIGPANFTITTVVNDTTDNLSATNSFNVLVLPTLPPGPPTTNNVNPNTVNWIAVDVPLNAVQATNTVLYASASVNLWYSMNAPTPNISSGDVELLSSASSGAFSVINTNSSPVLVPGSRYYLGVQNLNGAGVSYAIQVTFQLVVPTIPTFDLFSIVATNNAAGSNGFLITWFAPTNYQFHLQWSPALAPVSWTNFNGVISFASFLQATNSLFQYFDDGSQTGGFGAARYYRMLLLNSPTNTAPFFTGTPGWFYAVTNTPFVYTNAAQDWDVPAQQLTYAVTNTMAVANVTINPTNGVITWTTNGMQVGETNFITTIVTDNGVPPLSATNTFAVVVSTNLAGPFTHLTQATATPQFTRIALGVKGVQFQWTAAQRDQFQIRWTTNLASANWQWFPNVITSTNTSFSFVDTNTPLWLMKFYQLMLLP